MQKYLIIVEGKADIMFIKHYLMFLDISLKFRKEDDYRKKKQYLVIRSEKKEIKIFSSGGYTKIKPAKVLIQKDIQQGYKVLVIQDADDPTKNDGGVTNRMEYLNKIKQDINIDFESFLFPNHMDDGDLETLLLNILQENKYQNFYMCYETYVHCIEESTKKVFINELLEDKYKVFSYFSAYYGIENSKEENREYIEEYWDFNSDNLKPLKDFFKENFNIKSN